MKIQDLSKYSLLAVMAISAIVFAIFFLDWGEEKLGDYDAPTHTGLLLVLMYALTFITTGLVVWAVIKGMLSSKGSDPSMSTGVPGTKINICTWGLFVVSLVIGYVLGIGAEDFTAADGKVTPGSMVTIVDMFIWSIYILFLVAVVAVGVAMSGVLTKTASK